MLKYCFLLLFIWKVYLICNTYCVTVKRFNVLLKVWFLVYTVTHFCNLSHSNNLPPIPSSISIKHKPCYTTQPNVTHNVTHNKLSSLFPSCIYRPTAQNYLLIFHNNIMILLWEFKKVFNHSDGLVSSVPFNTHLSLREALFLSVVVMWVVMLYNVM